MPAPLPMPNPETSGAHRQNLALLVRLRWVAILGQAATILFTETVLGVLLPLGPMLGVIAALILINLAAARRCRLPAEIPVHRLVAEVWADVLALALLLFLSGGAANPFMGLFVLQDIVALLILPLRLASATFGLTLACGFFLLGFGHPLVLPGWSATALAEGVPGYGNPYLLASYLSFALSGGLTLWFMLGVRRNLARRDAQLAEAHQQIEEETLLIRMGLMASTAAHDLGTPLTNLAVILDDWEDLGLPEPEELSRQTRLMQEAVATCRETISGLLRQAGQARLEEGRGEDALAFVTEVARGWERRNRGVAVTLQDRRPRASRLLADVLLARALGNLMDNAREAGAGAITVTVAGHPARVSLVIRDDGPGFPPALLALGPVAGQSGNPEPGRGLGLILVQSVVRRLGGTVEFLRAEGGGAEVRIDLPAALRG
ncbi:ATP-binding protein [Rhodobacter sp. KR11]|uniref:ATP-binding protein n=1 Tax=Rhodobacter sp. KR11 TaxID=2974588 RepID=UPI002222CAB0|nr:ATP-binding protein [Rhodobacter sp. KR11]MCW1919826.1 ATP-binding protein [Rhodobacter sp. KR11]